MKFETEIELVNVLIKTLKASYSRETFEIFEEVSLGYGIADIVLSSLVKPRKKLSQSKSSLNICDINIYNLISKERSILFNTIVDTTKCSKKVILESLEKLIENKYVKYEETKFFINKDYELTFKNNFAVEAKLKDWKKAIKQAYRYKWFAEYSYVVLDSYYSNPAIKNINLFEKYNIGLATITTEGVLTRHFNPKRERPFDPKMQMLFSEKIKNDYEFAR